MLFAGASLAAQERPVQDWTITHLDTTDAKNLEELLALLALVDLLEYELLDSPLLTLEEPTWAKEDG